MRSEVGVVHAVAAGQSSLTDGRSPIDRDRLMRAGDCAVAPTLASRFSSSLHRGRTSCKVCRFNSAPAAAGVFRRPTRMCTSRAA